MTTVREAQAGDLDALVELESALFAEDAGQHDPYPDITWPAREGRQDFEKRMASPDSVILLAIQSDIPVGFVDGFAATAGASRQPIEYAVLRNLYVASDARRLGAASMLTDEFLAWARDRGCVEAQVSHYAANAGAQQFYERAGFAPRSISQVFPI